MTKTGIMKIAHMAEKRSAFRHMRDAQHVLHMLKIAIFLVFSMLFSISYGRPPCVKIRDGHNGYECMEFSRETEQKAIKYGLTLGSPYKQAMQKLIGEGWSLDRQWVKENEEEPHTKDGLFCGQGWDAICWTVFKKGKESISLTFNGTNEGIPLISVDKDAP